MIDKVAFGSCFCPSCQTNGPNLWNHVRSFCGGGNCVWDWLGDNMYDDTNDSQSKRDAYDRARSDQYYSTVGPVGDPKIPVTGKMVCGLSTFYLYHSHRVAMVITIRLLNVHSCLG